MQVQCAVGELTGLTGDALVVGVYRDQGLAGAATLVDQALDGALSALLSAGGLPAERGHVVVVHTLGRLPLQRVVVVGLGDQEAVTLDVIRRAVGEAWRRVTGEGARAIVCALHGAAGEGYLEPVQAAETVVEGALLSAYRFDRYQPEVAFDGSLTIWSPDPATEQAMVRGIEVGLAKAEATNFARDLVNTGPSDMRPADLADAARRLAAECGLGCTVLGEAALHEARCNLLLAVNRGADAPPALIILEHRGGEGPALGLVGKGVCFDSGGLSLKPADSMMTMKGDLGGAAAVLGAMKALATLRVPLNVTAVIPALQNLLGPCGTMPGDVVTGVAGKSVEILNTDAEGRLILADALAYAAGELQLSPLVDIATLTGACQRALAPVYAGVFGTVPALVERVRQVGGQSGEKFWELPLDEEYGELMKGTVGQLRNISTESGGGASSAAMFLKEFVGDVPWAHLDIAGHMFATTDRHYQPKGATGFGARTLVNLCLSLAKRPLDG